ncbi:TetR/AcrR family transcriptional regulator [Gordonia sp. (in: high G+C Gram-positive bacteria)]|uniref:TetR/AcrR family transcriptional regulator n=1 Tax=Gordonia sp. (in: high G+C Gram-positive bacteria) TaxID=84139 RepID=UPI0039E254E5
MHESSTVGASTGVTGGRKVGRKPAFTAADVVAAAIAEGVDRFTLAAVAQRLGVVTPAIYRLFPSRDDLVVACLDAAAATLRIPSVDDDWRAALRLWADECWRVCEEYPGLSRLVYSYPTAFTRIDHVLSAYAEILGRSGRTPGQIMFALDFIGDTVFASHLGVESMRAADESGASGLDRVRGALDEDAALQPEDSWADRGFVDRKVDFIIAGLERDWPSL